MEKLKFSIWSLLVIMLSSISMLAETANSPSKEFEKKYSEEFPVAVGAELYVYNKYGNVQVSLWDQEVVSIEVTIIAKTGSSSEAEEIFDQIKIEFSGNSERVRAVTNLDNWNNNHNKWWKDIFGKSSDNSIEIHYEIFTPRTMNYDLTTKYGILTCQDVDGYAKLTNKYSDISAGNIGGKLSLQIGYGSARIGSAEDTAVELKYGGFSIGSAGNTTIESKYSKVSIDIANEIRIQAKYDGYRIGRASKIWYEGKYDNISVGEAVSFKGETKHTDVRIDYLEESLRFEGKYGSVKVKETGSNFRSLAVESKYTSIHVAVDASFSLAFEGSHTSLRLPEGFHKEYYEEDGSDKMVKGYHGDNPQVEIKAIMSYGSLRI